MKPKTESNKGTSDIEGDIFDIAASEKILSIEEKLDKAINIWIFSLRTTMVQGHGLDIALTIASIDGDKVAGIAVAGGFVHWTEIPVPEKQDKHRDSVIRHNQEAKDWKEKLENYEKKLKQLGLEPNIYNSKLSNFKVYEVLRVIKKKSTKKGQLIV